jgi:hypothetical protein
MQLSALLLQPRLYRSLFLFFSPNSSVYRGRLGERDIRKKRKCKNKKNGEWLSSPSD